jgi:hypothetical protein
MNGIQYILLAWLGSQILTSWPQQHQVSTQTPAAQTMVTGTPWSQAQTSQGASSSRQSPAAITVIFSADAALLSS